MMIISFAWTTEAFLSNRKTRTRREWPDDYAAKFKVGDTVQAYDKQPRFHGKRIGYAVIKGLKKESISEMPDEDFEREGFAFMQEHGLKIFGKEPRKAFDDWRAQQREYWVVDFQPQLQK